MNEYGSARRRPDGDHLRGDLVRADERRLFGPVLEGLSPEAWRRAAALCGGGAERFVWGDPDADRSRCADVVAMPRGLDVGLRWRTLADDTPKAWLNEVNVRTRLLIEGEAVTTEIDKLEAAGLQLYGWTPDGESIRHYAMWHLPSAARAIRAALPRLQVLKGRAQPRLRAWFAQIPLSLVREAGALVALSRDHPFREARP